MPQRSSTSGRRSPNTVNVLVITLRYFTAFGYIPVLMLAFAPVFASGERVSKSLYQIDSNFTTIPRFKFSVVGDKSLLWRGLLIVLYFSGPYRKFPGIMGVICQGITLGQSHII